MKSQLLCKGITILLLLKLKNEKKNLGIVVVF